MYQLLPVVLLSRFRLRHFTRSPPGELGLFLSAVIPLDPHSLWTPRVGSRLWLSWLLTGSCPTPAGDQSRSETGEGRGKPGPGSSRPQVHRELDVENTNSLRTRALTVCLVPTASWPWASLCPPFPTSRLVDGAHRQTHRPLSGGTRLTKKLKAALPSRTACQRK